jgi:hypothetical protein
VERFYSRTSSMGMTDLLACQLLLYTSDDSVHRDVHFRARAAGEYLDLFFCELLADIDAIGNSDLLDDRDERPGMKFKDADLVL